jgi:hypothetical protein
LPQLPVYQRITDDDDGHLSRFIRSTVGAHQKVKKFERAPVDRGIGVSWTLERK